MNKISLQTKLTLLFLTVVSIIISYLIFKYDSLYFTFELFIFIILTSITESYVIVTPNNICVTSTYGIILSAFVLFGPSAGLVCAITSSIFSFYKKDGKIKHIFNIEWYKTLGNLNGYIISSGVSSMLFLYLNKNLTFSNQSIVYMLIAAVLFLSMDLLIISYLIMLSNQSNTKDIIKEYLTGIIPNLLGISALSVIIVVSYLSNGIKIVIMLFFPYLLIHYSFQLICDMKGNYLSTIKALSSALEEKDPYTKGHSERVEKYALILAHAIGGSKVDLQQLQYAAIFHDIGKIGIDDCILNKSGKLTDAEFAKIKEHPSKGVNILGDVRFLAKATKIIEAHHEYYDGTGYPKGLRDEEILLESKIITVVDIFDAITTDRPYRKAMTNEQAIDIIKSESGGKLNPLLVSKFIELYEKGRFTI